MQYREAYPYHYIELEKQITKELGESWIDMLNVETKRKNSLIAFVDEKSSRGEFFKKIIPIS
jgi:hypothetical protein